MRLHVAVVIRSLGSVALAEDRHRARSISTLFDPGSETNGGLIKDFGICDIQVEEDGAVFEQGTKDTAIALVVELVREYCLGNDAASKSAQEAYNGTFSHHRRRAAPRSTPSPNATTFPASTASPSAVAWCSRVLLRRQSPVFALLLLVRHFNTGGSQFVREVYALTS